MLRPRSRGRWHDFQTWERYGRVRTDARNRLVYQVGGRRLALDGAWALSQDHDLIFTARARGAQPAQTVYLKGSLLEAKADALVFAVEQTQRQEQKPAQQLALFGRWSADVANRLVFAVARADGSDDRLTLQGGWEVGPHHELLYRYRQRSASARAADERTLIFAGAWDITDADRLVYRLAGGSGSAFEFRAALQSPSLRARDGRLVYQAGIGVSGGKTQTRHITLFGTWKLNNDKTVSFEIPYAQGRREAIRFGATYSFADPSTRATASGRGLAQDSAPRAFKEVPRAMPVGLHKNEIALELRGRRRQPLGISVMFSRRLLEDARWFVRVRKEEKEVEALAGVQVRF